MVELEPNLREQCNTMILRAGKQLEGPKGASNDVDLHDENEVVVDIAMCTPSNDVTKIVVNDLMRFVRTPTYFHKTFYSCIYFLSEDG